MLYIHQLKDLTPKSAEIESTFIIRDLKKETPMPLSYDKVLNYFSLFFVSESEKEKIAKAIEELEPAMAEILKVGSMNDHDYEAINLQRALNMLREIPEPLALNLNFSKNISLWQQEFVEDFPELFNSIPRLSSDEEKKACNDRLNEIFAKLLRNDKMAFNYKDLINEAHTSRMNDLFGSMQRGFFFRTFLEEELKKVDFEIIKRRIPEAKLRDVEVIKARIENIKKGVDAAYGINLRMLNWALVVYSYIKWLKAR